MSKFFKTAKNIPIFGSPRAAVPISIFGGAATGAGLAGGMSETPGSKASVYGAVAGGALGWPLGRTVAKAALLTKLRRDINYSSVFDDAIKSKAKTVSSIKFSDDDDFVKGIISSTTKGKNDSNLYKFHMNSTVGKTPLPSDILTDLMNPADISKFGKPTYNKLIKENYGVFGAKVKPISGDTATGQYILNKLDEIDARGKANPKNSWTNSDDWRSWDKGSRDANWNDFWSGWSGGGGAKSKGNTGGSSSSKDWSDSSYSGNSGGGGRSYNSGPKYRETFSDILKNNGFTGKTKDELRNEFKRRAKETHPDKNKGNPNATKNMQDLNNIWSKIKNHPDFEKLASVIKSQQRQAKLAAAKAKAKKTAAPKTETTTSTEYQGVLPSQVVAADLKAWVKNQNAGIKATLKQPPYEFVDYREQMAFYNDGVRKNILAQLAANTYAEIAPKTQITNSEQSYWITKGMKNKLENTYLKMSIPPGVQGLPDMSKYKDYLGGSINEVPTV